MAIAKTLVCTLVSFGLIVVAATRGYGQHLADLKSDPTEAIRLVAPSMFFAVSAGAIGKISVAMTLLHVLTVRWQRMLTWCFIVTASIVIGGSAIFVWVAVWKQQLVEICKTRGWVFAFVIFGAAWSILTDFAFAILPWRFVCQLHRKRAERISLALAMSFGIVSGATAIAKMTQIDCKDFERDIIHDSVPIVIWTFAEAVGIIIAASAPILRFLCNPDDRAAI
ncbi:hypothetical protein C8A00DRAFT_34580 [Chaetomidium leptoderma]|uniref:Rhodopsin domain-containing protein n=1 Tax=Chaetomidium leptoderma TaxID=669021 RepID=A0AAN6VLW4_9PEZI|nr:hypothetical protein C8A00DRAFT_34580 [Chaetomidium leptoderma]